MTLRANLTRPIVWLQTSFLGDLVLHYPAFFATQKLFPAVKKTLVTNQIGYDFYNPLELFDEILVFEKKKLFREAFRLKKKIESNSIILQSHRSFRSSLLSFFLGGKVVTYQETNLSFLANTRISRVSIFHEVERTLLLLTALGVPREKLFEFSNSKLIATHKKEFMIGVAPGSEWGTKIWPKDYYQNLIQNISQKFPAVKVKLFGSPKELPLLTELQNKLGNKIEIVQISISNLLEEYSKLSLVIANDSAPIHLAALLNIPTLTFFGSTVPEMGFGPRAEEKKIFEVSLPCRPCHVHGPDKCPLGHFKCMKDISVEEVFSWTQQFIQRSMT